MLLTVSHVSKHLVVKVKKQQGETITEGLSLQKYVDSKFHFVY